jgi:hypothetical protein
MSFFVKNQTSTYHIHIPRTGGRFVTQMLVANNYKVYHTDDDDFEFRIYGHILMHLHYPLYEYLEGVGAAIQFAVVRNPFDRFVSSLSILSIKRNYSENFIKNFDDYNFLSNFIEHENMLSHYHNNWFRPQHEFLNKKVKLWKYENKLSKDFIHWLNNMLNDNIEHKIYSYYGDSDTELNPKRKQFKGSDKLKQNIELYYAKDYEILGY